MFTSLKNPDTLNEVFAARASLLAVSRRNCSVCTVLHPKIEMLFAEKFPRVHCWSVDMDEMPRVSAQLSIFTVPTVLVYFEGREYVRKSRLFSLDLLERDVARIYHVIFE
ncbi:MAG: thioredoxin family protein [Fibrobacterota bacterium]